MIIKPTRADIRFLLSLIAVHTLYFFAALYYGCIFNGDSQEYVDMAHNISKGWLYAGDLSKPLQAELMTLRPPGYPFFMWFVYLFVHSNWAVLFVQNIISIFNIMYLRHAVRHIGYTRKYDWVMLAFVVIYPSQYINTNSITPDLLLQTTVILYFSSFIRFVLYKNWRFALYMSLWLVVGLMIKPVAYPLVYIHALVMLLAGVIIYKDLLHSFLCAILPVLAVIGYGYFNFQRTGRLHFSRTQSFNAIFYYFNYYKDTKGPDEAKAFLDNERAIIDTMDHFSSRYNYANRRGMQLLKENFGGFMVYHTKHSLRMLIDPGKGEIDMFTGRLTLERLYDLHDKSGFYATLQEKGISGLKEYISRSPSFPIAMVVLAFNLLRLAGMLLFFFSKSVDVRIRVFAFLLIAYYVFIAGAIAHIRYFMPVSLIAMACAAIGFQLQLQRLRNTANIAKGK